MVASVETCMTVFNLLFLFAGILIGIPCTTAVWRAMSAIESIGKSLEAIAGKFNAEPPGNDDEKA